MAANPAIQDKGEKHEDNSNLIGGNSVPVQIRPEGRKEMKRRGFLKLCGAVLIAPSIPLTSITKLKDNEFMYRGQKFRGDYIPRRCLMQIYMSTEINRKWYGKAIWIAPKDYDELRDNACDQLISCMERTKRRVA